jgi:hypothetical protein
MFGCGCFCNIIEAPWLVNGGHGASLTPTFPPIPLMVCSARDAVQTGGGSALPHPPAHPSSSSVVPNPSGVATTPPPRCDVV